MQNRKQKGKRSWHSPTTPATFPLKRHLFSVHLN